MFDIKSTLTPDMTRAASININPNGARSVLINLGNTPSAEYLGLPALVDCFPSNATVFRLRDVDGELESCQIDQIRAGDTVLSGAGGKMSTVIGLTHTDSSSMVPMLRLDLESGHQITMTHGHLVLKRVQTCDGFQRVCSAASSIRTGDDERVARIRAPWIRQPIIGTISDIYRRMVRCVSWGGSRHSESQ